MTTLLRTQRAQERIEGRKPVIDLVRRRLGRPRWRDSNRAHLSDTVAGGGQVALVLVHHGRASSNSGMPTPWIKPKSKLFMSASRKPSPPRLQDQSDLSQFH